MTCPTLTRRLLPAALALLVALQPAVAAWSGAGGGADCGESCCCAAAPTDDAPSGGCCGESEPASPEGALLTTDCPCRATAPGEPTPHGAQQAGAEDGEGELRERVERNAQASAAFELVSAPTGGGVAPPPRPVRAARDGARRTLRLLERGIDTLLAAFGTALR